MAKENSNNFRKLVVWQMSKKLIVQIYHTLLHFPKDELYGLTSQMKRASISVASNIAEGNQKRSKKEKIHYLNIAQGSLVELDCQLEIALDLNFMDKDKYRSAMELVDKTGYLLTRLIQSELEKLC
jgi:four helix bundle protein